MSSNPTTPRPRTAHAGLALAFILVGAVILAYASLLPRAHWQGDEYTAITDLREGGWTFFQSWSLGWSPRLISNIFYAVYAGAVTALHRPLTTSCMALLWLALGCACVLPAGLARAGLIRTGWAGRCLAGLSLFALLLCGHGVSEVFYWPGGGLSYIPTLSGAVLLFWLVSTGLPTRALRIGAAAALLLVAGSSEVGIFLALTTTAAVGIVQLRHGWRSRSWLVPGALLAALDLALVLHGRVGVIENAGGAAMPTLHHAGASLLAAVPVFLRELAMPEAFDPEWATLPRSLVARLCILLAARWTFGGAAPRSRLLPAFAAALLLASFASVASAYYQFGALCCQRHDTMRACFVTLAIVCLGAWSPILPPRLRPGAGMLAWVTAVLILFVPTVPAILADRAGTGMAVAARAQTWTSGLQPGPAMVMTLEPSGRLVASASFPPGVSDLGTETAWYKQGILRFFGKIRLDIRYVHPAK